MNAEKKSSVVSNQFTPEEWEKHSRPDDTLVACIRDPNTGEIIEVLYSKQWLEFQCRGKKFIWKDIPKRHESE